MKLDSLVSVCMVVVSVAIVADIGARHWNRRSGALPPQGAVRPPAEYKPGDSFDEVAAIKRATDRASLVFVLRSTCPYCTQSMPFYQRLVGELRGKGAKVQLNGVCTEPTEACERYLATGGLALDHVAGVASGTLKVAGTPTLVLVRPDGRVEHVWKGLLSRDGEQDVIDTVMRTTLSN